MLKKYLSEKLGNYSAPVGCWNCDEIYDIRIKKGVNVPEHLIKTNPPCKECGCDSLKPHMEYVNEKEIMKDLVLHHRMQQMEEKDHKEVDKSSTHFQ